MAEPDRRPPTHDAAPVKAPVESRQGVTGHRVRYVLGAGLALVIVAFALIYIIGMMG